MSEGRADDCDVEIVGELLAEMADEGLVEMGWDEEQQAFVFWIPDEEVRE